MDKYIVYLFNREPHEYGGILDIIYKKSFWVNNIQNGQIVHEGCQIESIGV